MVVVGRGISLQFSTLQTKAGVCFLLKLISPSSRQSILTRAQLKLDEGAFQTDACGLHKKQWIQVMDAQSWFQNPQGFSQNHLC